MATVTDVQSDLEEPQQPVTERFAWVRNVLVIGGALYVFLFSINLLGRGFQLLGEDFAVVLLETTANPFLGLFLGILATSLIQSSSTTTSIIVGLVAADGLSLSTAIPVLMGANVGTSVTNTLVSFGHATRRAEFRRAFSSGIVHDVFNVCSVAVLFPVELAFRPIERVALVLQAAFTDIGGMALFNPLKAVVAPVVDLMVGLVGELAFAPAILIAIALALLFTSLAALVKTMRSIVVKRAESAIDKYLFGRDFTTLLLGVVITFLVQSSSISTSLIVPLAGAGILSIRQVYPYTLGANIGTTFTAILAALATGNPIAVTASFAHLVFNLFGILIFYPLRFIPISVAERLGIFAGRSRRNVVIVIVCFFALYLIPLLVFIL